jgi:hypothetical protein
VDSGYGRGMFWSVVCRIAAALCVVLVASGCDARDPRTAADEVYRSGGHYTLLSLVGSGDAVYVLEIGDDSEDTPVLSRLLDGGRMEAIAVPQICPGWLALRTVVTVSPDRVHLVAHCDTAPHDEITTFTLDAAASTPTYNTTVRVEPWPAAWGGTGYVGGAAATQCGSAGGLAYSTTGGQVASCAVSGAQLPAVWTGTDLLYACTSASATDRTGLCRTVPGGSAGTTVVGGFAQIDDVATTGADVLLSGQPGTGRRGVFRVSPTGVVTRIATGPYRSPTLDRRTGRILAMRCDGHLRDCRSVVHLTD